MYKKIVKKVIDYIEDNLENEIDLDKIAENIGYSKFHLNRIFTEETGYNDLQVSANAQTYDCRPKTGRYGETDYPDCL